MVILLRLLLLSFGDGGGGVTGVGVHVHVRVMLPAALLYLLDLHAVDVDALNFAEAP